MKIAFYSKPLDWHSWSSGGRKPMFSKATGDGLESGPVFRGWSPLSQDNGFHPFVGWLGSQTCSL